jgi:hypothetical protein
MPSDLSETGKLNLFRTIFQGAIQPGCSAGPFDEESPEEHESRIFVKLAVAWTLSGFPPGPWQRIGWIESVIWELRHFFFDSAVQEGGSYAKVKQDTIYDLKEKLLTISDRPNFAGVTCEELFRLYVAALIPKGYLTRRDILDFMPRMKWPLTREEAGEHLSNAYGDDELLQFDSSRGVAVLVQRCLNFHYQNTFAWWVSRTPRVAKVARTMGTAKTVRTMETAKAVKTIGTVKAVTTARVATTARASK